jgi:ribosomal protein S21
MPIIVEKKKGESKDDIIGKFRRLCLEEDITEEVRRRTAYIKPSEERYAKKKIIVWRDKCRKRAKNSRRHDVKR